MDAKAYIVSEEGADSFLTRIAGVRRPRVAVVVGCYNQAAYLEATLRSVAAQRYEDFECVIIDDSSTDGSSERIEQVVHSLGDRRFRTIHRPVNGGQMVTMLEGLDATSSHFVAFLDADDLWHPEFLERHVLAHVSSRGLAAVSCSNLAIIEAEGIQLSGGKSNFIYARQLHRKAVITEEAPNGEARIFVAPGIPPGWIWSSTSGMMFRRTVLNALRPARPERIRICADHYLARGSHMLGGTVRIERSLGCYRLHGGNAFSRNMLLGGQTSPGRPPIDIVIASKEEFIRCLCDRAEELQKALSPKYLVKLLIGLAGREGALALATTNPGANLILSSLPPARPDKRLKRLRRRLAGWLNLSSDETSR